LILQGHMTIDVIDHMTI